MPFQTGEFSEATTYWKEMPRGKNNKKLFSFFLMAENSSFKFIFSHPELLKQFLWMKQERIFSPASCYRQAQGLEPMRFTRTYQSIQDMKKFIGSEIWK